jgi:amino acid adenylation domain-containing protein
MTIADEVIAQSVARPRALAVSGPDGDLSYGELNLRSGRLGASLRALGVGPDAVVAVLIPRSAAMVVASLAVLRAGGAYLPIDPAGPDAWIRDQVQDAGCAALICLESESRDFGCPRLGLGALGEGAGLEPPAGDGPRCPAGERNLAYLIYTSGSTGRPKGVEVTHAGLSNLVRWHREAFGVGPADRASQVARVGFDAAVWETWPPLACGAALLVPPEDLACDPEGLRDWIVARRVTLCFAPTPLAERLVALRWPACSLRFLLTGADTLHRPPPEGLGFALVNNYGPTECTVVATSGIVPAGPAGSRLPPIGMPIANTTARILDESMNPVPAGAPGELFLGGPGVARGYRNLPELTRERFLPDPFAPGGGERLFRTGDIVQLLADGQIAFLGRADEQVKVRGFRVETAQVAAVLCTHPSVSESVVAARDNGAAGKGLVAYLVPFAGPRPGPAELQEFLSSHLPDYMVPSTFVVLEALPLTANGKVDRQALPAPGESNLLRDRPFSAPRSDTERAVASILSELLGVDAVDANANFFSLGGHSLLGTQLIVRIRHLLRVELPLRTVFEAPTVAELAREVDRRLRAAEPEPSFGLGAGILLPNR